MYRVASGDEEKGPAAMPPVKAACVSARGKGDMEVMHPLELAGSRMSIEWEFSHHQSSTRSPHEPELRVREPARNISNHPTSSALASLSGWRLLRRTVPNGRHRPGRTDRRSLRLALMWRPIADGSARRLIGLGTDPRLTTKPPECQGIQARTQRRNKRHRQPSQTVTGQQKAMNLAVFSHHGKPESAAITAIGATNRHGRCPGPLGRSIDTARKVGMLRHLSRLFLATSPCTGGIDVNHDD